MDISIYIYISISPPRHPILLSEIWSPPPWTSFHFDSVRTTIHSSPIVLFRHSHLLWYKMFNLQSSLLWINDTSPIYPSWCIRHDSHTSISQPPRMLIRHLHDCSPNAMFVYTRVQISLSLILPPTGSMNLSTQCTEMNEDPPSLISICGIKQVFLVKFSFNFCSLYFVAW